MINIFYYFSESDAVEAEPGFSNKQLALEVRQLTKERDHLLAQSRKDSERLERKEMELRAHFEEKLQEYTNKISQVNTPHVCCLPSISIVVLLNTEKADWSQLNPLTPGSKA